MNILNLERSKKSSPAGLYVYLDQVKILDQLNFFITPHILCWTWRATDAL